MNDHTPDPETVSDLDVAIVGMACRFPEADDPEEFWRNLRAGRECVTHFTEEELRAAGVPDALLADPAYVRSGGRLREIEHFDAGFFGYSPREAEVLEPSHRIFLECAWEALEAAGWAPERVEGKVGVYAGAGHPGYSELHIRGNRALMETLGGLQANLAAGKDFLATRTAYKLGLRGPAISVQTACSTSLVAVHLAVQGLLTGETDMALAGGATVQVPQVTGYLHAPGSIVSPDGRCRAFDAKSAGTLSGSGVGVVVLKRLADALRDGDRVRAVIRGSAVNNDGSSRVAFSAPGVEGQAAVIAEALAAADVSPESIGYVEAHGSGTDLGDTIEIAALTRAWRAHTDRTGFCTVGAVKTSLGHLDAAAGVAGLIKTVLSLEAGELAPTLHFQAPNPKIDFASSPFVVRNALHPWARGEAPRRAAVSSFGIGGTNAHVVLEEAPPLPPSGPSRPWQLLALSARSPEALDAATERLAAHLGASPGLPLADVAHTLQQGRRAFSFRRVVTIREGEDAAALLAARAPERTVTGTAEGGSRSVVFLFPGLGDHYPQMARGLYEAEPVFRAEVDRCAELLLPRLGVDLRELLYAGEAPREEEGGGDGRVDLRAMLARAKATDPAAERLNRTELAQPAVFVIDYALAKLWESWGIVPEAVIGHSLGEYVAACVAGVLSLEDALALVADRARLVEPLPGGAMLAVSLEESALRPLLPAGVAIATVNAPGLTVASGAEAGIAALETALAAAGHTARRLATTHAFHSPMMEPAAAALAERVAKVRLSPPRIPMVSNVTGGWMTDEEATDPGYWTRHLLGTVRFAEGVGTLLAEPGRVLVEVGPGQTLSTFVRQRPGGAGEHAPVAVVPSLRYPYDRRPDTRVLAEAAGRLWTIGVEPDWAGYRRGERRARVPLPTYPWERQRYWVEASYAGVAVEDAGPPARRAAPAEWTELPAWTRAAPASAPERLDVVLYGAAGEWVDRLASAFERAGHRLVLVRPGDAYSAGRRLYTVRPDAPEDFNALVEGLRAWEVTPRVVHAGGFGSLLPLAAAMDGFASGVVVVSAGGVEVTGSEALDPDAAALLGASRTVAQERPGLLCRVVDVDPAALSAPVADRVVVEAASGARDEVVALRGRHRWVRSFRPARPDAPAAALREGGVYLLLGGVQGRQGEVARALAARGGARLAFAPEPPAELARALEAAGATVLSAATPAEAVEAAVSAWGEPDGVFLAPTLGALAEIGGIDEAAPEWETALAALHRALEEAGAVLDGRFRGFRVVESSLAGAVGAVGRARAAAANTLTEAWAAANGWTAAAWDRPATSADEAEGIAPAELPAALDAVLALAGEPLVLVSPVALEARIRAAAEAREAAPAVALHARPQLEVAYDPPSTETEELLAEIWQSLLGIDRIGVADDFFALGGHSLLATQIVARVRQRFGVTLPLGSVFEAPTIARYALLVEDAILAELEEMSEEEAERLIGA